VVQGQFILHIDEWKKMNIINDNIKTNIRLTGLLLTVILVSACGGGGSGSGNNGNNNNGLIGSYYEGITQDGLGNIGFDGLTKAFSRTDSVIDFWDGTALFRFEPVAGSEDLYSVQWKGFINIDTAGDYGFGTISDDGSEVWIDGNLIVDNAEFQYFDWEDNISESDAPGATFPVLTLSAGLHEIEVRFYESFALDGIELWWLKPGLGSSNIPYKGTNFNDVAPVFDATTNWEIIPNSVLFTTKG